MTTTRQHKPLLEIAVSVGRRAARLAPAALLLIGIACTNQQASRSVDERTIEPQPCDALQQTVKEQQQRVDAYESRINSLEREVAELRLQLDERLKPTTVPATLPSDSTTLPARVPAP